MIESAQNEYEAAVQEERSYSGQLEAQKGAAMDLDRKSGDYQILQREAEADRRVYNDAAPAEERGNPRPSATAGRTTCRLAARGGSPRRTVLRRSLGRDWLMALIFFLRLALGVAFGIESLDDTGKLPKT